MNVLVFGAHPDDVELCCGGTVKKLTTAGHHITIADLTRGEMGTRGTPELRQKEAKEASGILGVDRRVNLEIPDGKIQNTEEYQSRVIQTVRTFKPHLCLITAPGDRHPDHTHATELLLDAIYFSGLKKIITHSTEDESQQKPWRPSHVLHYMQDRPFEPDLILDISDTMEAKIKSILAYGSQFNVDDDGPETYISSSRFFKNIKARARHYGHLIGTEFGEPLKYQGGPIPLNNFQLFEDTAPKR